MNPDYAHNVLYGVVFLSKDVMLQENKFSGYLVFFKIWLPGKNTKIQKLQKYKTQKYKNFKNTKHKNTKIAKIQNTNTKKKNTHAGEMGRNT